MMKCLYFSWCGYVSRRLFPIGVALVLMAFALPACESTDENLSPASMAGVTYILAEEFDAYPDVEAMLPEIAGHPEIAICLAIRAEQSQSDELRSLLLAAAREGVPIIAWLLLSEEEGYWFSEENLEAARTQTYAFLDWIEEGQIPLEWLMLDMEMSLEKTRKLEEGDLNGVIIPMLQANLDPEAFASATQAYAEFVGDLKQRGYKVSAAAYPFILDDLLDEDSEIQDAFNTPIEGVGFDEIYFMAYRTSFANLLGMMPGPYIVYEYAMEAKAAFGNRGVIGLGIIGDIGQISDEGYTEPEQLAEDIAAARAGGNERVFIFSLDGMNAVGPLDEWLQLKSTEPSEPETDKASTDTREILALLDEIL